MSFQSIVQEYGVEDVYALKDRLLISDDTQMSLYLIQAVQQVYHPKKSYEAQENNLGTALAQHFIMWLHDPENGRLPGNACIGSLTVLEKHLQSPKQWLQLKAGIPLGTKDTHVGGAEQFNSKGSGTVMRSPWVGLLNAQGIIPDAKLEQFSRLHSAMTHQHLTAINAAYLTAWLTSKLYKSEIHPGQLAVKAKEFCQQQEDNLGWRELLNALERIETVPQDYYKSDLTKYDISEYTGFHGTAEDVLVPAIALLDTFGSNPVAVIQRAMYSTGDSDTIGAVAGGMIGAYYDVDIWGDLDQLMELNYVPQLDGVVEYLENAAL